MHSMKSPAVIPFAKTKNPAIANKDDLFKNEMLYPFIIETIFFFYDTKNWEYFNDIEIIQLIQQHSIELFKEFILEKRTNQENEALINYIFDYAYYLKSKNNDENNLNKIGAIIRLILSQILESSNWDINLITKFCIKFMLFFKNIEKLIHNKEIKESYLNQDEKNLFKTLVEKRKKNDSVKDSQRSDKPDEIEKSTNTALEFIYNDDNLQQSEIKLNDNENINNKERNGLLPEYIYQSLFLNKELPHKQ